MQTLNCVDSGGSQPPPVRPPSWLYRVGEILETPLSRTMRTAVLAILAVAVLAGSAYGTAMTHHYRGVLAQQDRYERQLAFLSGKFAAMELELARLSDDYLDRRETYRKMIEILEAYGTDIPAARRQEFVQTVYHECMKHGLDPILAMAVIKVESTFDPTAVSPMGAVGLMQVIPYVGRTKAEQLGITWRGVQTLYDPVANVQIGLAYLMELVGQFKDFSLALEAYNRGPGAVRGTITTGIEPSRFFARRVMSAYTHFQKI